MFCVKCGNRLDEGSAFCPKCGTAVSVPRTPGTAPQAAPVKTAPAGNFAQAPAQYPPAQAPQMPQAPAPPPYQNAPAQVPPQTVLVKGLVYAWHFKPGQTWSWSKMLGKFEVMPSGVRFYPTVLRSSAWRNKHTVEIPVADIASVTKTGFLPTEIEIAATSGYILKIRGYFTVKKALKAIKQLTGLEE